MGEGLALGVEAGGGGGAGGAVAVVGAPEELGEGEEGEAGVGEEEAAVNGGDEVGGVFEVGLVGGGEFLEAFPLAFRSGDDAGGPSVVAPLAELVEDFLLAVFGEDEVAGVEVAEGGGEGFEGEGGGGVVGEEEAFFGGFGVLFGVSPGGAEVAGRHPVAEGGAGLSGGEEEFGGLDPLDGALAVGVDEAEGLDLAVEELGPDGVGALEGEDVEDAAAAGELAAGGDGGDALEAGGVEFLHEGVGVGLLADAEGADGGGEGGGVGDGAGEGGGVAEEDAGFFSGVGGELAELGEEAGGGLGVVEVVGLAGGFRRVLGLAEGEGGDAPEGEFVGELLAAAGGGSGDPEASGEGAGGAGDGDGKAGLLDGADEEGRAAGGEGGEGGAGGGEPCFPGLFLGAHRGGSSCRVPGGNATTGACFRVAETFFRADTVRA